MMPADDVKEAILAIIAAQDSAWRAGDAAAFGVSALPDVVFTNVVGMFSVGVQPFIGQHAHIFATFYQGSLLVQELVHLKMITAEVAIVDTLAALTGYHHLPPGCEAVDGVLQTRLEQVMVLRDGAWRMQSFHNVCVNPTAVAAAKPQSAAAPQ